MRNVRRIFRAGVYYFFTVVTYQRQKILCHHEAIQQLRESFKFVIHRFPFQLRSIVILPDHIHCIWLMPSNDGDFAMRWRLIKSHFSKKIFLKNKKYYKKTHMAISLLGSLN